MIQTDYIAGVPFLLLETDAGIGYVRADRIASLTPITAIERMPRTIVNSLSGETFCVAKHTPNEIWECAKATVEGAGGRAWA